MEPNFFLIGAPKCGTSAIASYLRDHPQIFMTEPKEPYFLGEELRPLARVFGINTDNDYDKLYARADKRKHLIAGEASTLYLSSPSALERIASRYSKAKLVAIVRNPVDAAYAFHMQMCLTLHEPVSDFRQAWDLQDVRSQGQSLPRNCKVPRLFQYREMAAFGSQLEKLFQIIEPKQILVVAFDELAMNCGVVYRRILEFLEVPDDGRIAFPKVNEANTIRSLTLARFHASSPMQKLLLQIKNVLPNFAVNSIRPMTRYLVRKESSRQPLAQSIRDSMRMEFLSEIRKMEKLMHRDLSMWLTDAADRPKYDAELC